MRVRRTRALLAGLLATALLSSVAVALISTKFTPVHLVKDADLILQGTLAPAGGAEWSLEGATALKGKPEGAQLFSAAAFSNEQREELLALLKARPPAVLFACRVAKNESKGFVHAAGRWLSAKSAGAGRWDLLAFDPALDATFSGGTDMLAKMSRYILEEPRATVPVSAGMTFDDWAPVTKSAAPVTGLAAVHTGGKTCLFVASPGGDRLFAPAGRTPAQPFEELTARVGLDTRSKQFAWLDMDGDGLSDLVSFDGAVVLLRLFKNGELEPAGTARTFKLDGNCLGLAAAGMSPRGTARVLVSTEAAPRLLEWSVAGWAHSELPDLRGAPRGKAAACIVADLNGDGWVDVLQPGEHSGVFWAGTADGFAAPALSAVRCPGVESCFALGDFDGDGSLDIFAGGPTGNELWANDGHAGFRAVLAHSGSLSYRRTSRWVPPTPDSCTISTGDSAASANRGKCGSNRSSRRPRCRRGACGRWPLRTSTTMIPRTWPSRSPAARSTATSTGWWTCPSAASGWPRGSRDRSRSAPGKARSFPSAPGRGWPSALISPSWPACADEASLCSDTRCRATRPAPRKPSLAWKLPP
ncbi:MAG: VCBS repeat-containing protein [Planctomycetota bacterium]|nr:VCBS repeat-containing protein [Planctomycetota bacterium]